MKNFTEPEKPKRLADLDELAFGFIARGHEANLALGGVFNAEKSLLGHGQWQRHFAETFATVGVALRTAQHYMKLAHEAAELSRSVDLALLPPTGDAQAVAVTAQVGQGNGAVATAPSADEPANSCSKPKGRRNPRLRLDGIYRLPVHLTGAEKDDVDALRRSQNWTCAELALRVDLPPVSAHFVIRHPGH